MAKTRNPEPPVNLLRDQLREIHYCVGKNPLHKLALSGLFGSPGYTEEGAFQREGDNKYVSVRLGVRFDVREAAWKCYITITDADDMHLSYTRPFTLEEWKKAVQIYNDLDVVDPELLPPIFI